MKRILFCLNLALCGALMAQSAQTLPSSAYPPTSTPEQAPAIQPMPAPAPIHYLRYSSDMALPLITHEMRVQNDRRYHDRPLAELVSKAKALDSYIFDGLRLARSYGPADTSGHHHGHGGDSLKRLEHEYHISHQEAAAWVEASHPLLADHYATVAEIQQELIPQAIVICDELMERLPPVEVRDIMPGTAAYRDLQRPHVVVPQPQGVIVAPQPIIVQPAFSPAINVGIGVEHRW